MHHVSDFIRCPEEKNCKILQRTGQIPEEVHGIETIRMELGDAPPVRYTTNTASDEHKHKPTGHWDLPYIWLFCCCFLFTMGVHTTLLV